MTVDVKDLPPAYQAQALRKLMEQERKKGRGPIPSPAASTAALERAGKIRDLRLQVDFTLQEAYTDGEGRRVRAIRYRADFTYQKPSFIDRDGETCWALVVEDVKSRATKTKQYAMKRKMMQEHFGIYIQEV